jgi:hypothetical protein
MRDEYLILHPFFGQYIFNVDAYRGLPQRATPGHSRTQRREEERRDRLSFLPVYKVCRQTLGFLK